MKASIIIDNYNYGKYVADAIESALMQDYKNKEIIVVDDGSTDDSLNIINRYHNSIIIIKKENGGQISSFNEAVSAISGDIVFALDSDDTWKQGYLTEIMGLYEQYPNVDFMYGPVMKTANGKEVGERYRLSEHNTDLGLTHGLTLYTREFLGSPSSALSCRTKLYREVFPYPYGGDHSAWMDICWVTASSLLLARKYFYAKCYVNYRIHEDNYSRKKITFTESIKLRIMQRKLRNYYIEKQGLKRNDFIESLAEEMKSGDKPEKLLRKYLDVPIRLPEGRAYMSLKILFNYFRLRIQKRNSL